MGGTLEVEDDVVMFGGSVVVEEVSGEDVRVAVAVWGIEVL